MGTDGNEGRRPGGVAENWGRPDRIRAGAVSGPWRNVPKSDVAPPPAASVATPPPARPREVAPPESEHPAPPHRPRLRGVWTGVAVGLALALAIVGAAVLFGPASSPRPPEPATEPAPEPVPEPAPVEAPVAAAPEAVPPPQAAASVQAAEAIRLRVGPNLPEAERDAIAAALEGAGYGPVQVEVLPFPIAASRVGYYRAEDAAAAEALAAFVRGVVQGRGIELSTRDYSRLLEDAAPGRLDIWIEG